MLYELIAVVAAGFLGGGLATIARRVLKALPRWSIPVAAGGAMMVVAVSLEYSWFDRTRESLPDGVEVALANESRAPWRPWTYLHPFVDRFIAVDRRSLRTHRAAPDLRMVDLVAFARWTAPQRLGVVLDCDDGRRADLVPGVGLTEDGRLEGATWHEMGPEPPATRIACATA